MGIVFLKAGLYTTVQDMGREGQQKSGFHVSGVMDREAYQLGNMLVGNENYEGCLEYLLMGPTIRFTTDAVIALTGGNFQAKINDVEAPMYEAVPVKAGDELAFGFVKEGVWGYLSIAGGLDIPLSLGSRATDIASKLGGVEGRKIKDGDSIELNKTFSVLPRMEKRKLPLPEYGNAETVLRVVMGPQEDYFSEKGIAAFLGTEYTVTDKCDRMGYRLEGEYIEHNEKGADIISDGIAYGAIQVPSQGQPIAMLADRQTTGGYTKIATIISTDIPKLVQSKSRSKVRFEKVSVEQAQQIYIDHKEKMDQLNLQINGPKKAAPKKGFFARLFGKA